MSELDADLRHAVKLAPPCQIIPIRPAPDPQKPHPETEAFFHIKRAIAALERSNDATAVFRSVLLKAAVTGDIMGAEITLKHWKAHVGREQWR